MRSGTSAATAVSVWARTWVSVHGRRRRRGPGHRPHRGHHRAAAQRRAARVGGHPRRAHRAAQPLPLPRAPGRAPRARPSRARSPCCSSTSTTSRSINDSLGHDVGDQLLQAMTERLRSVVRDRDMLGRFGGDEFIVMLRDVSGSYDPLEVAERLRAEIAQPLIIDGAELFVTASIGITLLGPTTASPTTEMLRDADAAMYRAKAAVATASRCSRRQPTTPRCSRCAPPTSCAAVSSAARSCPTTNRSCELEQRPPRRVRGARPLAPPRPRSARPRPVPADGRGDRAHRRRRCR